MIYLINKGLPNKASFKIMEKVRKGKGLTDDDIETAHSQRQNQAPNCIVQVQHIGNNHIVCNHTAIEDHRDEHHPSEEALELVVRAGKHIANHCGQQHTQHRTHNRDHHGNYE